MAKEWQVADRAEKRVRSGHPWVFANELAHSPKGITPGEIVKLCTTRGAFMAWGYGNPHSLIAFRRLSDRADAMIDQTWVVNQLLAAARRRRQHGLSAYSHRLIHSEADFLPGIIVDRYVTTSEQQLFVVQVLTAGAETLLQDEEHIFKQFTQQAFQDGIYRMNWEQTRVVVRRDQGSRNLEGLPVTDTPHQFGVAMDEVQQLTIQVRSASYPLQDAGVLFTTDFVSGQKTGFFLDQSANIRLLNQQLLTFKHQKVSVLDLFTYVGQWGTQIAHQLVAQQNTVHVVAVDASKKALEFAAQNIRRVTPHVETLDLDIVAKAETLPAEAFDVVVCDPPALIKSKKDHPQGKKAYAKVNAAAMRALKPGGMYVTCSCSHHLSDQDFEDVIMAAESRSGSRFHWLARGYQGEDHPMLMEFPQGRYLKAWIGQKLDS